jgi:hypothetical protein
LQEVISLAADPETQEVSMSANVPPRGRSRALLFASIASSLVSLAVLAIHPQGTGSWRASLNIVAVLLVITATLPGRAAGGPKG